MAVTVIDPDEADFDENGIPLTGAEPARQIAREEDDADDSAEDDPYAEKPQPGDPDYSPKGRSDANGTEDSPASLSSSLLRELGIEDGLIEWEGQETRIDELPVEDQLVVFKELLQEARQAPSELPEHVQAVVDYLTQGGSAEELAREILGTATAGGEGAALSDDEVNALDIRRQFPGFTDEQVEAELEDRRAGKLYETKTQRLRELQQQEQEQQFQAQAQQQLQQERQLIIDAAAGIKEIAGFPVTDEAANMLLEQLVEPTERGDSAFLESLSDPKELYETAYWKYFGPAMATYYEQQVSQAYEQGRREALEGAPEQPIERAGGSRRAGKGSDSDKPNVKIIDEW